MIVKFRDFINENNDNDNDNIVILDNGMGGNEFKTLKYGSRNSIAYLNAVIKRFIENVYGPFGFRYPPRDDDDFTHFDMDINNKVINTEYIAKMVNNYTIFKSVIRNFNIIDEDTFYHFMMNNLNNIYHYNGNFFKSDSLPILIRTTRKGNISEKKSIQIFLAYSKSKNIEISIEDPTLEEDIDGVDFKFSHNGRQFTVQVKPYDDYKIVESEISKISSNLPTSQFSNIISVSSPGSLSLNVDYLILYNENNYIILRNPSNNRVQIRGKEFVTDYSNVVKII